MSKADCVKKLVCREPAGKIKKCEKSSYLPVFYVCKGRESKKLFFKLVLTLYSCYNIDYLPFNRVIALLLFAVETIEYIMTLITVIIGRIFGIFFGS
jgi:hypothetical protein